MKDAPLDLLTSPDAKGIIIPENETLAAYFAATANRYPDRIALEYGEEILTYRELRTRAGRVAHYLRGRGVKRGDTVGLFMPRGIDMFVGMLGILKAGAAYVPMDPSFPLDRVAFISSDSDAKFLLTHRQLMEQPISPIVLYFDELMAEIAGEPADPFLLGKIDVSPQDLAYIIYTSGTTGRPKGVMIRHESVCHFIRSESSVLQLHPDDHVFQGFSLSFDMSIEEIWTAFYAGARLYVASTELVNSGPELSKVLGRIGITVWHCVPTMLAMQGQEIPSLRLINLGGEACPADLVQRWSVKGRRLLNTYGPTETTVTASYAELQPGKPVTIGKALPGYDLHVLDENLFPVPSGQEGELCISGIGLAVGYVKQPELTREKFTELRLPQGGPDLRVYRSGDLVRLNADGDLLFLGRIDSQVKIRGFRVELGEIETILRQNSAVQTASVALLKDNHGMDALVGFVVLKADSEWEETKVWQSLRQALPSYMVPSLIEPLTEIPLLPSGKVDRKKLKFPAKAQIAQRFIIEPSTLLEMQLHRVWTDLFDPLPVSIDDDFFQDLGGHSLRAALMVSQLRKDMSLTMISMQDIYQHSTIRALAASLEQRVEQEKHASPPKPFHVVPSWRYALCTLGQGLGLLFIFGIFALQWLLPYLSYSIAIHQEVARFLALFMAFGVYALTFPLTILIAIAAKWLVIGRYQEGDYPLWGSYYLRWWFVRRIQALVPEYLMRGSPLIRLYFRCLGADIGRNVYLGNAKIDAADLVSVGEGTSIGDGSMLSSCSIERGQLKIRSVKIGKHCVLGHVASVGLGAQMEDFAELGDLSMLPIDQVIPKGEVWAGSPAIRQSASQDASRGLPPKGNIWGRNAVLLSLLPLVLPLFALAPIMPGLALFAEFDKISDEYHFLLLSPVVAFLFVLVMCLEIIVLKWLIVGRMKPGKLRLASLNYTRYWFVSRMMDISLDLVKPLYATLYLAPWYRALGVKVGPRAEISTASAVIWDLLQLGEECFVADGVSLGAPRVAQGEVDIQGTSIGRRTFLGNSALVPAGAHLGDQVLVGCLSVPPSDSKKQAEASSSWFGSPALFLPQRQVFVQFDEGSTFRPRRRLYILRLVIEFIRVLLPLTCVIGISSVVVSALVQLRLVGFNFFELFLVLPLIALVAGLVATIFTILVKRQVIGTYKPTVRPLWNTFVWGSELVTCLYENLAVTMFLDQLRGTPFINLFLRALGCQMGARVYTDTTDITEFDVVKVGDDVALNDDCGLQTHLFEDRVMKISRVDVGDRCTIGSGAIVLYDSVMEPDAQLGDLSMLMKAETLPRNTEWEGSPAQRISV